MSGHIQLVFFISTFRKYALSDALMTDWYNVNIFSHVTNGQKPGLLFGLFRQYSTSHKALLLPIPG
jgi:hypothetical protein